MERDPANPDSYRRIEWIDGKIIPEHVAVAQVALGKAFDHHKHPVHHVNGRKSDNSSTNLVICENRSYHQLLHRRGDVLHAGGDPNTDVLCRACHTTRLAGTPCMACFEAQQEAVGEEILEHVLTLPRRLQKVGFAYREFVPIPLQERSEVQSLLDWHRNHFTERELEFFMDADAKSQCPVPKCEATGEIRGLCKYHYQMARSLVAKGKTSWEILEAQHKARPPGRLPGEYRDPEARDFFLSDEAV